MSDRVSNEGMKSVRLFFFMALTGLFMMVTAMAPGMATARAAADNPEAVSRPFRLRTISFLPSVNHDKPLGRDNRSGLAVHGDAVIGDFSPAGEGWVGSRNFNSGKVNWWFDAGSEVTSPMVNLGGFVVFGTRNGKIFKVDVTTGKRAWEGSLDSFTDRRPVLAGNILLIQTTAQVLYGIDYQTGKSLWLFDAGFPEGLTVVGGAAPVVSGDIVIAGLASGEVVAAGLQNGKLSWRANPVVSDARFRDVVGEMHVREGILYLTRYDGIVAAVDIRTSDTRTVWQEKYPAIATSAVRNGRLYLGCVNGDVVSLDQNNQGRQLWRTVTGAPVTTLTAAETRIVATSSTGRVTAMDLQSGATQWHDSTGYSVTAQPMFMHDGIYFLTGLGNAYGYRL